MLLIDIDGIKGTSFGWDHESLTEEIKAQAAVLQEDPKQVEVRINANGVTGSRLVARVTDCYRGKSRAAEAVDQLVEKIAAVMAVRFPGQEFLGIFFSASCRWKMFPAAAAETVVLAEMA